MCAACIISGVQFRTGVVTSAAQSSVALSAGAWLIQLTYVRRPQKLLVWLNKDRHFPCPHVLHVGECAAIHGFWVLGSGFWVGSPLKTNGQKPPTARSKYSEVCLVSRNEALESSAHWCSSTARMLPSSRPRLCSYAECGTWRA